MGANLMSAAQKVLLAVALLALAPAAVAKSKVALVIGNGAYQYSSNFQKGEVFYELLRKVVAFGNIEICFLLGF